VLLAVTGLALRHLPMSAALSGLIGDAPWYRRLHLAWVLVDESFGLTINASQDPSIDIVSYKTATDMTLVTTWLISTAIGANFGTDLDASRYGAEVIFPLVFLGLAAHLAHGRGKWVTAGLAAVAAVLGVVLLPAAWRVTGAALVAALIGSRFE
jgi:predicted branched-subunit amino acid permease